LVHPIDEIAHFVPREAAIDFIVGFVSGLLQVNKDFSDESQVGRDGYTGSQSGDHMGREAGGSKAIGSLPHLLVSERPSDEIPQRRVGDHHLRRFIDKKVEECVIGGRNRPSKARLPRPAGLSARQMPRLFQQIVR
jgi:hypothetical protein